MLRNRSRAVAGKQNRMTDHGSLPSPNQNQNQTTPISSFLGSPRFFNGLLTRSISDVGGSQSSPTSILDSKPFTNLTTATSNLFGYDKNVFSLTNNNTSENGVTKYINYEKTDGIGLALLDDEKVYNNNNNNSNNNISKPDTNMVLFGAKLKVQIPPLLPISTALTPSSEGVATPKSPADFGIKTRNSQLLMSSSSAFGSPNSCIKPEGGLSFSEMELSEDYTCVITHGPNPKTTHIFDDCIVESCCGVGSLSDLKKEYGLSVSTADSDCIPVNFLRFCYTCKNILGDGTDIYMYRLVSFFFFIILIYNY